MGILWRTECNHCKVTKVKPIKSPVLIRGALFTEIGVTDGLDCSGYLEETVDTAHTLLTLILKI